MAGKGFTLIELIVVLTIIGTLTVMGIVNYRSFQRDQALKSGIDDTQSTLKRAQSNAISGVKCQNEGSASWSVEFSLVERSKLFLQCKGTGSTVAVDDSLLDTESGVEVFSIVNADTPTENCTLPVTITFAPSTGAVSFSDPACSTSITKLRITLKDESDNQKSLIVEKAGGGIYGE